MSDQESSPFARTGRGRVQLFQVDAFTAEPFRGNPAAVCLLDNRRDADWMQAVAAEMNLSETAFILPKGDEFCLRWFTPTTEVDLCGHATLAGAHTLWETGRLALNREARFQTRGGMLRASRAEDWISLDFPAFSHVPASPPVGLREALGIEVPTMAVTKLGAIITLKDRETVQRLTPDFGRLAVLPLNSVTVTSEADSPGIDFVSRFFAPKMGIDEDPVTGSSHCALAPFWALRLGRQEMTGFQASPRGGTVKVCTAGDRVFLSGQAVTVMHAELL